MELIKGNLYKKTLHESEKKGWFVGHFIDENSILKTENVEVKWAIHKKGDIKKGLLGKNYSPILIILIKGKFKVKLNNLEVGHILSDEGDYICFDSNKYLHESEALEDGTLLVIRWPSVPNNFK